jgi:hypothetical protein
VFLLTHPAHGGWPPVRRACLPCEPPTACDGIATCCLPYTDSPAVDRETRRRALADRVLALAARGIISAPLIETAREGDQIMTVDFRGTSFEVALYRRAWVAQAIPTNCGDELLDEMSRRQPVLQPGEATATWCFAVEWDGPRVALEIHFRLRAWRTSATVRLTPADLS